MSYNEIEIYPVNDHLQVRNWITPHLSAFELFFIGETGHETIFLPKTPPRNPKTPEEAVTHAHALWATDRRQTLFANQAVAHAFYALVDEVGRDEVIAELQGLGLTAAYPEQEYAKYYAGSEYFDGLGPDYTIAPDTCSFEITPEIVVVISEEASSLQQLRETDVPGIITKHATARLCDIYRHDTSKKHLQRYADAGFAGDLGL